MGREARRRERERESRVVMACLDIDPSFRDVTTVPQLSTPYTPARVRVPINTRHAYMYAHTYTHARARALSLGMLRSYVWPYTYTYTPRYTHISALKAHRARARAHMCAPVVYESAALPETFWEKSFPFPDFRRSPIAPCVNFAVPPVPLSFAIERTFRLSRVINRRPFFARVQSSVICFLTLQFSSRDM